MVSIRTVQDQGASAGSDRYHLINWTTYGTSTNFTARIASNISWTRSSLDTVDYEANLAASVNWNTPPGAQWGVGSAIVVTDLLTGQNLWTYSTNDTLDENIQSRSSPIMSNVGYVR